MNIGAYQKWYAPYSFRNCQRLNACKHVDFLILLRRLLYSENLNSPSAQTVSLSLYTILAKFRKSAYCLFSYNSVEYKMIYKFCFAIKNINYEKRGVSHSL